MTDTPVPDAAVQIAAEAIAGRVTPWKTQSLAENTVAALARAGWLHDPAEAAALRYRVESQDAALRTLHQRLGDTSAAEAALDALRNL